MIQPQIVLADAVGQAITVAFVVISLIGWIINLVNAQAKPTAPNRGNKPGRPRSERVQSEIEQFMREQAERKKGGDTPEPKRQPVQRRTTTPPARAQRQPQRQPQRVAPAPEPKAARPGESIAERHVIGSRDLGKGLREHVRTTMQERVQAGATQHLTHSVDQSVSQHLGSFTAQQAKSDPVVANAKSLRADDILALLRTRDGMRQAFILNEILQRPKFGKQSH